MCVRQREICVIVVEDIVGISCGMARQTYRAAVHIASHACVFLIGFGIGMAGSTGKLRIVGGVGMTVHALYPFPLVFSAVYWEILRIMIKSRR